jgi:peroxiredoxin
LKTKTKQTKKHEKAVRFIADDQALFVSELGLVFDATPILGAPRAKVNTWFTTARLADLSFLTSLFVQRFVIVANDDTIETVIVEDNAGEMTQTEASVVLALL